jgi:hypothetical protein
MVETGSQKIEKTGRNNLSIKSLIIDYLKNKKGHKAYFGEIFDHVVKNSISGNIKLLGKTPKNTVYTTICRTHEIKRSGERRHRQYEVISK